MGTKRNKYYAEVGGNAYVFSGAEYLYEAVKSDIGVKLLTERTTGASGRSQQVNIKSPEAVKRVLPKIRLVMVRDGVGNSAQTGENTRRRTNDIYVDPDKAEDALKKLPGKTVGGVAGAGDFRIIDAYIPLRRCYR